MTKLTDNDHNLMHNKYPKHEYEDETFCFEITDSSIEIDNPCGEYRLFIDGNRPLPFETMEDVLAYLDTY